MCQPYTPPQFGAMQGFPPMMQQMQQQQQAFPQAMAQQQAPQGIAGRIVASADDIARGDLLKRVVVHEIGRCIMHSYGLVDILHRMVKRRYWVEAEEWACNILAEYGELALDRAEKVLGSHGIVAVPKEMERLFT